MPSMRKLIENGDLAGVKRAVQDDAALLDAAVTTANDTPLMWAICKSFGADFSIAQWLVKRGANLDVQTSEGATALMLACRRDRPGMAQMLIKRGAKLDLQNNFGWTSLMWACRNDQPDTVQLLIERGAKLDLQNNKGNTALMLACQQPEESLHSAARLLRCIKLCCAAGAALELKNDDGKDALAVAKDENRADAVAFLEFATMLEVARGMQGKLQQPRSVVAASLLLKT
ncbi:Ankyrin repeat domain-containing protein 1 [Hondaea fermentalgiana]|uniref:Ankyrin repeat domain-containing protein 1 n=1 Tax=Hondaea fermentalgiana TaxID=2315210 RepID=A0A2R5GWB4_9STRA|nr:Ankyrin repeat domain-containing protein 1 [Hondaea fermentalgiana]|eukprot:GBG35117.1 Ankyrin repeat domain-containing protein 1 [Hondaea fermentalgiana]